MIIDMSVKLKQKTHTMHLEVKMYDLVGITQTEIENPRNDPRNLRFLAAQCLLLASKFQEVQRLYPAELVYQIKGWNEKEYSVLQKGTVEEYILKILNWDLIFLTPADFLNFFSGAWNHVFPSKSC